MSNLWTAIIANSRKRISYFSGVANFLLAQNFGRISASTTGATFSPINQTIFQSSNVNKIFYSDDFSQQFLGQTDPYGFNIYLLARNSNLSSSVRSIGFGSGGLVVAVGGNGQIRTSLNTTTWTTQTSNFGTTNINAIVYGNGIWTIAGDSGRIDTSLDAVTWTTQTSNFGTTNITSIAYGNGRWVAVGNSGTIRTSVDTINWITQASNFGATNINYVAYGNGRWVAVGNSGLIRTSTDSITWSAATSNFASNINAVAYGNGRWVAVGNSGQIRSSTDTTTWTTQTSNFGTGRINNVAYGRGFWTAVADFNQLRTSSDGLTWVTRKLLYGAGNILSLIHNDDSLIIGGEYGAIQVSRQINSFAPNSKVYTATANDGRVAKSTDGLSWVSINTSTTSDIYAITNMNGGYYPNGASWTGSGKPAGEFVHSHWVYGNIGVFAYSTDSLTWFTSNNNSAVAFNSITHGNNVWIGVGNSGTIRRSTDLITWTTQSTSITTGIQKVGYGNGLFVLFNDANILTSVDGITWTTRSTTAAAFPMGSGWYTHLYYENGIFVGGVRGTGYNLNRSTDGITWTLNNITGNTGNDWCFANGFFAVAGFGFSISTDLLTWTAAPTFPAFPAGNSPSDARPFGVAGGNGMWIVGGYRGTEGINFSTDLTNWGNVGIGLSHPIGESTPQFGNGIFYNLYPPAQMSTLKTEITYPNISFQAGK